MVWPAALARLRNICVDLLPRRPPPHWRRWSSYLSELVNGTSECVMRPADNHSQVSLGGADDGGQLALVFALDILNGQNGGSLLVNHGAETGLALDNDVGNTHLSAEGREVDDKLNRVDIVGNDDQGGFLGLDEGNGVVETVLDKEGLLRFLRLRLGMGRTLRSATHFGFSVGGFLGGSGKTSLLLLLSLGSVPDRQ